MRKQWLAKLRNSMQYIVYGDNFDEALTNAESLKAQYGKGYRVIAIELY